MYFIKRMVTQNGSIILFPYLEEINPFMEDFYLFMELLVTLDRLQK